MAHTDPTQDRGDLSAYDRYLRGMNTSMRQKVALTAAHLLGQGRVADMGMGSGLGSHALAALYPRLEVIGVDLDPTMVALAGQEYRLPNLSFRVGDIGKAVFEPGSLDGIFDSSVLHHVTSYQGYRYENAAEALEAQVGQLRSGGVLIVRDFVAPEGGEVLLDLPADDGDDGQDSATCSTARLLERFAGEFRSLSDSKGFPLTPLGEPPGRPGWRRYRLEARHGAEFLLRKDYRRDWASEVREEYGYFTQAEFEAHFARLGLRVLASTPIRNPWILRNRWEGRVAVRDLEGRARPFPPTNYLIVGERVPVGEGVRFRHAGEAPTLGFLKLACFRHRTTGEVWDLVRRPFPTVDVVPWFEADGELYVLARMSYPRPIPGTMPHAAPTLDERRPSGYVTEPLTALQTDEPLGFTVEGLLEARAGLPPSRIRQLKEGTAYYPSPGGILEEVRSVLVETDPVFVLDPGTSAQGARSSGRVRAIEARQLLRAAQVGGLSDARLELNVYELLLQRGERFGDWIGDTVEPAPLAVAPACTALEVLLSRPGQRAFETVDVRDSSGYLALHCGCFEEVDALGNTVGSQVLEYVVPERASTNTVTLAMVFRQGERVLVGIEERDLPAMQGFTGRSNLLAVPAWRLPMDVQDMPAAKAWLKAQAEREFSLRLGDVWELGGPYHPTAGLTPESVHPFAVQVDGIEDASMTMHWVPVDEALACRHALKDGHLRVVLNRLCHATAGTSPLASKGT